MSRATRKYDSLDLIKLYSLGSNNGWIKYLDECVKSLNINSLARMRYSLQASMTDLVNKKLNDDRMNVFYVRLLKSVENTAKQIVRIKHPLPHDTVIKGDGKDRPLSALEAKRRRDKELEYFFNKSSF